MFRIVVADPDELLTRRLVAALTRTPGLRVVGHGHAAAGLLDVVRRTQPDVVLVDLDLARDGLIAAIRREVPAARAIVITDTATSPSAAVAAGADGMLLKGDAAMGAGAAPRCIAVG